MDTNQQEAKIVPEGTQDAPMPSAEQQPSEQVTPAKEVPVKEVSEGEESDAFSLPDGVKDRTSEQFDKLKQRLADERSRRLEAESYLSSVSNQSSGMQEKKPLYDPATGYVDVNELERIREANTKLEQKARQVEEKFEKYLQKQQETEAYQQFPELDPTSKDHNEALHRAVRALITDSLINPRDYGGKELTMRAAADMVAHLSEGRLEEVEKSAKDKFVKELTPKEQASLEVGSRSDGRDHEELPEDVRTRSREGDMQAIMERMKNL
jgi:hypothetical protein